MMGMPPDGGGEGLPPPEDDDATTPSWHVPHVFRHFLVRTLFLRHLPLESFLAHLVGPFVSKHVA